MKKVWIISVNIIIVISIVTFVSGYSYNTSKKRLDDKIRNFTNMTASMEKVTTNYLEGEQHICDVWAHYINSQSMTIDEAVNYIRVSHVRSNIAAHILYASGSEELTGLSTRPGNDNSSYQVSYKDLDILDEYDSIKNVGEGINITRTYINPMNGTVSIAFYNKIDIIEDGTTKHAFLLRVIPVSELEKKWTFPGDEYKTAQISILDSRGSYIIKGSSLDGDNIYDFYKTHNKEKLDNADYVFDEMHSELGNFRIFNSKGEECVVAHVKISSTHDWCILGCISLSEINTGVADWFLIGIVAFGLLSLLIFDFVYMMQINKKLHETAVVAKKANSAKTKFLSTMSHDIRTPMNAIVGFTALAKNNLNEANVVEESLDKINLASNHLLTLVNDILDISKIESGKINIVPVDFSLKNTITNLLNIKEQMVKEKNITFALNTHNITDEYLYADELRINQIFINILSNAIKYTAPLGKVYVDIYEVVDESKTNATITYKVSDTGIGMDKEYMKIMYEPFSRQTDSRVNLVEGTGLGLAITKRMVEVMGGQIDCESIPNEGTTFVVKLTLPISKKIRETGVTSEDYSDLANLNILVAEDNDINWQIISKLLAMYNIKCECATNGEEAINMLKSGKSYDFIFMDIQMPVMNGLEATRRIRALDNETIKNIPVIAMTADAFSENIAECMAAGMNGHIAKPIDIKLVLKEIRKFL